MDISISTFIDIIILALLVGTIFYAIRLSQQLAILKDSKGELEQLVSNLSINIRRAHEAIQEMQEISSSSGDDLHKLIVEAQDLSHELQIMTESGDRLADRLEHASSNASSHSQHKPQTNDSYSDTYLDIDDFPEQESFERPHKSTKRRASSPDVRAPIKSVEHFFIRDRDFEEEYNDNDGDDYDDYEDEFQNLSSRAEKQLASALRRNRKFDA